MNKYDVIVVGAGSMGMAAGYNLAKSGKKVLLIDAFDPPHSLSSHEGDTRYVSAASGEGGSYTPMTLRALELFREMDASSHEQIFVQNGALTFGVKGSTSNFVETAIQSAKDYDIKIEYFENGSAFKKRWPDLNFPEEMHGVLEPRSGTIQTTNTIRWFKMHAIEHGAEISIKNPVHEIEVISDDLVRVRTQNGTYEAKKIVLTAGAYTKPFLKQLGINIELSVERRVLGWFDTDEMYYSVDKFPAWYGDTPIGVYYGFGDLRDDGMKIGKFFEPDDEDIWSDNLSPEYIDREFGVFKRDERELREFLSNYMPKANGHMKRCFVGMWTNTADENYVLDFHPDHKNVVIGCGFSGNGFKAVPAVGEILSELIIDGESKLDISDFKITRDALKYNFSEQTESLTWGQMRHL